MPYFQRVATSPEDVIDYFDRTCFNFSPFISIQRVNGNVLAGPPGIEPGTYGLRAST